MQRDDRCDSNAAAADNDDEDEKDSDADDANSDDDDDDDHASFKKHWCPLLLRVQGTLSTIVRVGQSIEGF